MKNFNTCFLIIITFTSFTSLDNSSLWGSIGHKVVGEIAERKLNPSVKLIVNDLLDGESMSSASTWADEIKSDPKYQKHSPWPVSYTHLTLPTKRIV